MRVLVVGNRKMHEKLSDNYGGAMKYTNKVDTRREDHMDKVAAETNPPTIRCVNRLVSGST